MFETVLALTNVNDPGHPPPLNRAAGRGRGAVSKADGTFLGVLVTDAVTVKTRDRGGVDVPIDGYEADVGRVLDLL